MQPQRVTRLDRTRPAQFVDAAADDAVRERQRLDDELHGHRGRVPAAGDELLEEARARARLVEVERLRVEFAGESFDRTSIDNGARGARSSRNVVSTACSFRN